MGKPYNGIEPFPKFSWSLSRKKMFDLCKRQYYCHFYGSHNGWRDTSPEKTKTYYRLKTLKSVSAMVGSFVQDEIVKYLKAMNHETRQSCVSLTEMQNSFLARFNDSLEISRSTRDGYLNFNQKMYKNMLRDIFFGYGVGEKKEAELKEKGLLCLSNFATNNTLWTMLRNPEIEIVEFDDGSFPDDISAPRQFYFDGVQVHSKLNLLLKHTTQKNQISFGGICWRTGKDREEDENLQPALYSSYVCRRYHIPLAGVRIGVIHLPENTYKRIDVTENDLTRLHSSMYDSIASMQEYVQNVISNEPLPEEKFEPTPSKEACRFCNFFTECSAGYPEYDENAEE